MKKTVLGLDLGSASIGWALISEGLEKKNSTIIDMGCRIIPYDGTEGDDFAKGRGESRNSARTLMRGARRGYDRYQMRRAHLVKTLKKNGIYPNDSLRSLPKMELWELRSKAVTEKVTLQELGRLLLWLNQKRGYKSARSDVNLDKKDTDYVAEIKSRHETIKEANITIGQYFYKNLLADRYYRVKENVFPREAYIEEFNAIVKKQQSFHPILSNELLDKIRDEIIYFQRALKSQKGLVAICEFEGKWVKKGEKEYFVGPKVAHRSSPIFQHTKIWEAINNLKLRTRDRSNNQIQLTQEEKRILFNYLDNNDKLTLKQLCKLLNFKESEIFVDKKLFSTGIQGNSLKVILKRHLSPTQYSSLTQFNIVIEPSEDKEDLGFLVDRKSGEIIEGTSRIRESVSPKIEQEPLYKLWHTIYSIPDIDETVNALISNFNIDRESAEKLAKIDLNKFGYSNKSVKTIRKTLPYLMEGYQYSDAMMLAGYNHSGSLTKDENLSRQLAKKLKPIAKNSLRQPIVEKILNQMINLVNAIIDKYGDIGEIRVELARELKQNKADRADTTSFINKRTKENERITKEIEAFGLRATRNNIIKYRLFEEIDNEEKRVNAICIYCGKGISITDTLRGDRVEVEHIVPRSKLFDDSQSNKTLAHTSCNSTKGNLTAYDFMKGKSVQEFQSYIDRVHWLYDNHLISRTKRDRFLMPEDKIPDNFLDRQIRETQYISKKAREILNTICHNVYVTSGSVTAELRHLWGWNDIIMNLQMEKYREANLTEIVTWQSNNGRNEHQAERIIGWDKRSDHRHHAIDALTVACTKQGYIQRLNTLNSQKTRKEMKLETEGVYSESTSLLERYLKAQTPFTTKEVENAISKILISFKPGKKVATRAKRKIGRVGNKRVVQEGILVPRGQLSKESVYGKIKILEREKPLKYLLDNPDLIVKEYIRKIVVDTLQKHDNNPKKALAHIKKNPIFLDSKNSVEFTHASCFKEEYVIKYPVNQNFNKVDKVIDNGIKEILKRRLAKFNDNYKEAFRDVEKEGDRVAWYEDEGLPHPILSVRCSTGLSAVVPISRDEEGREIGFVKPGNNHHIAIYTDQEGNLSEHICTFWHAVERKRYGLPVVIKDTNRLWDSLQLRDSKELPQQFLQLLPMPQLTLRTSLQENEMFLMGLSNEQAAELIQNGDMSQISDYLFRVQKISSKDYNFRHHYETQVEDNSRTAMEMRRFLRIRSLKAYKEQNPIKIKIDLLGELKLDKENAIL